MILHFVVHQRSPELIFPVIFFRGFEWWMNGIEHFGICVFPVWRLCHLKLNNSIDYHYLSKDKEIIVVSGQFYNLFYYLNFSYNSCIFSYLKHYLSLNLIIKQNNNQPTRVFFKLRLPLPSDSVNPLSGVCVLLRLYCLKPLTGDNIRGGA